MSNTNSSFDSSSLLVRDQQGDYRPANADEVLRAARRVLGQRMRRGAALTSPQLVREFLRLKLGTLEHEIFAVLLLDAQNRLIEYPEMFRGTVTQTSVYPREIVKESLARNAAAVIFAHNHFRAAKTSRPARTTGRTRPALHCETHAFRIHAISSIG